MSAADRIEKFFKKTPDKKVDKIRIGGEEFTPDTFNYHKGETIKLSPEPERKKETKKEPTEKEKLFEYIKTVPDKTLDKLAAYVDYLLSHRAPTAEMHEEKAEATEIETLSGEEIQEAEIIEEETNEETMEEIKKDPAVKELIKNLEAVEEKSSGDFRETLEKLLETIDFKKNFEDSLEDVTKHHI